MCSQNFIKKNTPTRGEKTNPIKPNSSRPISRTNRGKVEDPQGVEIPLYRDTIPRRPRRYPLHSIRNKLNSPRPLSGFVHLHIRVWILSRISDFVLRPKGFPWNIARLYALQGRCLSILPLRIFFAMMASSITWKSNIPTHAKSAPFSKACLNPSRG